MMGSEDMKFFEKSYSYSFLFSVLFLCTHINMHAMTIQDQDLQPEQQSWFSYITSPIITISNTIKSGFSAIRNYFSRSIETAAVETIKQQFVQQEIPKQKNIEQEKTVTAPEPEVQVPVIEIPEPERLPFIPEEEKKDIPVQHDGVFYDCVNKRLKIVYGGQLPYYFNFVDRYEWSPQKKYISAMQFSFSAKKAILQGAYNKTITWLIDPHSDTLETAKKGSFENVKTYRFSPEETKLFILTLETSKLQLIGITQPSIEHAEPTGIIPKDDSIFKAKIFDLASNSIIKEFENIVDVAFNNEEEITVYFEDGAVEVHSLKKSFFGVSLETSTEPLPQKIKYIPHTEELTLVKTEPQKKIASISEFYFSPQGKYIVAESASLSQALINTLTGNKSIFLPITQLVNVQTGEQIELSKKDLINIITYEFSPDETTVLCTIRMNNNMCEYRLFDITKQDVIMVESELEKARSVKFKNDNELVVVDQNNNEKIVTIDRVTLEEEFAASFQKGGQEFVGIAKEVMGVAKEAVVSVAEKIVQQPLSIVKTGKKFAADTFTKVKQKALEKVMPKVTEFSKNIVPERTIEERKPTEKEEKFFSSVISQAFYEFKKYVDVDKDKADQAIKNIFALLTSEDKEEATEAQETFFKKYSKYTPEEKQKFISALFVQSNGIFCSPKHECKGVGATSPDKTVNAVIINRELRINDISDSSKRVRLGVFPNQKTKHAMLFSKDGKFLAISYKKELPESVAPLYLFIKQNDNTYAQKDISLPGRAEIDGLLFLDNTTLLCVDRELTTTVIDLNKAQSEKSFT